MFDTLPLGTLSLIPHNGYNLDRLRAEADEGSQQLQSIRRPFPAAVTISAVVSCQNHQVLRLTYRELSDLLAPGVDHATDLHGEAGTILDHPVYRIRR